MARTVYALGSITPIPPFGSPAALAKALPISDRDAWVDWYIEISANAGGSPDATSIHVGFTDARAAGGAAFPITVEDVDGATGAAPQAAYLAESAALASPADQFRLTTPASGVEMIPSFQANSGAAPDAGSTITVYAIKRSR